MIFPLALAASVLVGVVALLKRRSGGGWGLSTLLAVLACWWLLDQATAVGAPSHYANDRFRLATVLLTTTIPTVVALTVLVTLPTLPNAAQVITEDRVPCPVCAEMIMRAAKKCRFCGVDFGAGTAGTRTLTPPLEGDSNALEPPVEPR